MWQRFFIIVYFILHIPLVAIPIYSVAGSAFLRELNTHEYKARCLANNQYVIVQGSTDYTPYVVSDLSLRGEYGALTKKDLAFYCAYFNEIQPHIRAYQEAKTPQEQLRANEEFFNFKQSKYNTAFDEDYSLEMLDTKINYTLLWSMLFVAIGEMLLYYLILQLVRIIYTYIVLGKIVWHPYRFPR